MTEKYACIVVGLGAMGSASLYQLAKLGSANLNSANLNSAKLGSANLGPVLGIDRFSPPHIFGSTHGDTRITRQAIGEGDQFIPLTLRSYEIFREVEKATGMDLLTVTGGLMISSENRTSTNHVAEFFKNTLSAARKNDIKHDILDAKDIRRRFPQFSIEDNEVGYFEYEAGFLRPENCVEAQLQLALQAGASVHTNEQVLGFNETSQGVRVKTDQGEYIADAVVVSAGPWLPGLFGKSFDSLFKVYRQVLYWFDVETAYEKFVPEKFPIFIWEVQGKGMAMYGFPAIDGPQGGLKIGSGRYLEPIDPDEVDRQVSPCEIESMYEMQIEPYFPLLGRKCVRAVTCMYTVTADAGFVIDRHPDSQRIIVCSSCSGHGFKHSAAIGECVAQMVACGQAGLDLSSFALDKALTNLW